MTLRTTLMRRALAAGLFAAAAATHALQPGETAPALALGAMTGTQAVPVAGKVTYVDFWASWCGPCRKSFPWMNEMQRKYAGKGLVIVGVNLDQERSDAEDFLSRIPAEFPVAFDPTGDAPTRYGVKGMPTSVLVGADGKVLAVHAGFNETDAAALEDLIRSHLGVAP